MAAKNPFDDLYDKVSELLNFVKTHHLSELDAEKIPPDIEKKLDKLQRRIDSFNRLSENIVRLSGISAEELKMRLEGTSEQIPPEGKKLIQKGREVKEEAHYLTDKLAKALKNVSSEQYQALPPLPKEEKAVNDKEYVKKRRSKFKRFGSDDTWKPL